MPIGNLPKVIEADHPLQSEGRTIILAPDDPPYNLWRESPIEQEAELTGPLLGIGGRNTEFPGPDPPCRRQIVVASRLDGGIHQRIFDALLAQFMGQTTTAMSASSSMYEGLGVANVRQLTALLEILQQ